MTLRALGENRFGRSEMCRFPAGPKWLSEFVCDDAEFSHRYYEKLIAHYDIHKGATRPEEGLDDIAQGIVAEFLIYAANGFGHVLDAAITEAGVAAPEVTLTAETFLAMTQIPAKFIEKRLTNAEDRKLVAAMYDELKATGRVEHYTVGGRPHDPRSAPDARSWRRSSLSAVERVLPASETGAPIDVASPRSAVATPVRTGRR